MRESVRFYDRERKPYTADRKIVEQYAIFFKQFPWQLFGTFTFAWKVSDQQAIKTFDKFIDTLGRERQSVVGYVRGDEKRFSGCGKPACPRHFHALLTCTVPLTPEYVESLWMSMAGHRSDDAGAQVKPYDSNQNGISYVLKFINHPDGDWDAKNLHLFLPSAGVEKITKRMQRNFRRHHFRDQQFACAAFGVPIAAEPNHMLLTE